MRRVRHWIALLAVGLSTLAAAPSAAIAKPKVEWTRVNVPDGPGAARLQKTLKQALAQAVKHASFGKSKKVVLSARMAEFVTEEHGDVLRVSCTVMGRVVGGAGARSRISYGGSPTARDALEKQVVTMVANGLVARLAQIARTGAPRTPAR